MLKLLTLESEITEPLAVEDMRAQAQIEHNDEDAYLGLLISAARAKAEEYLGAPIVTKNYEFSYCFTAEQNNHEYPLKPNKTEFSVPMSLVLESSIVITYQDSDDQTQNFTDFDAECGQFKTLLRFNSLPADEFIIRFTAGHEAFFSHVSPAIKIAILMIAATLYDQREDHSEGVKLNAVPMSSKSLLDLFRDIKT